MLKNYEFASLMFNVDEAAEIIDIVFRERLLGTYRKCGEEYIMQKTWIQQEQYNSLVLLEQLTGKEPVKRLFRGLCDMKVRMPECSISLPSVFVVKMQSGQGFSTMVERISNILDEYQLLKFRSKERLVEYTFTQEADNMMLLKQRVRSSTVFSNEFWGVQAWDIDIPLGRINESFYQEIGRYIKESEGRVCFFLRVYSENQSDFDRALTAINK